MPYRPRSAPPQHGPAGLRHPYFDPDAPEGPRMTGAEWLDWIRATPGERALVALGVERMAAHEAEMQRRVNVGTKPGFQHNGYRNGKLKNPFVAAMDLLDAAKIDWRRQVTLLNAVLRYAKEAGISTNFTGASSWRKRIKAASVLPPLPLPRP